MRFELKQYIKQTEYVYYIQISGNWMQIRKSLEKGNAGSGGENVEK